MGVTGEPDLESSLLHTPSIPEDKHHFAYIIYFIIGLGYLLPWNVFITAVDYFSYLYPDVAVDRIFAAVYMLLGLVGILLIIFYSHKSDAFVRINVGLGLFVVSLVVVPVLDAFYVMGRVGLYGGFYVTALAVGLAAVADALVQGSIVGSAGLLPERYMQAVIAGTAGSGILVSVLRIFTKAVYSQDASGLRKSANLYFAVSIVIEFICIILYNIVHRLPVIKYYNELKIQAITKGEDTGPLTGSVWRSSVWDTVGVIKWYGLGIVLIYAVTLAIFPGYITEDVHSQLFKDWYPVLLIAAYNVGDLVGKCLTAVYLLENAKVAIGSCIARLAFFPLFLGCLHGPNFFRTEIPVTVLTCLLGITSGYLTSVLMILAPKIVKLQHAEIAGIVSVLFLAFGLAAGSVIAWFWVI
ncbi:putative equilibrative nucleoside transporter [Lupinus albus]|uniref:Putative equilibrative nucleoside transporter n=1 Tax=Lupinus albus TaxID=3870 RepID=A0A6A4R3S5_LUPAL|nr:putative equilibrative nucleoside transporter [Lupinus albus]